MPSKFPWLFSELSILFSINPNPPRHHKTIITEPKRASGARSINLKGGLNSFFYLFVCGFSVNL